MVAHVEHSHTGKCNAPRPSMHRENGLRDNLFTWPRRYIYYIRNTGCCAGGSRGLINGMHMSWTHTLTHRHTHAHTSYIVMKRFVIYKMLYNSVWHFGTTTSTTTTCTRREASTIWRINMPITIMHACASIRIRSLHVRHGPSLFVYHTYFRAHCFFVVAGAHGSAFCLRCWHVLLSAVVVNM